MYLSHSEGLFVCLVFGSIEFLFGNIFTDLFRVIKQQHEKGSLTYWLEFFWSETSEGL